MSRIESSNSINMFKQCPRKYYYCYKLKMPTKESIAMIAGNTVHDTLEGFFSINLGEINHSKFEVEFEQYLIREFHKNWSSAVPRMIAIKADKDKILEYYEDSLIMLNNFLKKFCNGMRAELAKMDFAHAFERLRPETEVYIVSDKHKIQGYIDAVYFNDGEITVVDYKTSRKDDMSEQYKLQLAIYSLLSFEKYGKIPKKVFLYFLRQGSEKAVEISPELIKWAEKEAEFVHLNTESNLIEHYPKSESGLCNWCDFYESCFGQKNLKEY